MEKFGVNQLREMFLSFFETKGHLRLPSFSLIPQNDASLLLINSGMAPMKPYFKGEEEPPRHRVCTCQKCIRTGDIENIGKTARHGTYFEMLGNFSFGDYFKHEAIAWSWEFLTSPEWVGLDPNRLYPSIYEQDDEAFDIWNKEIGIAPERIFRFGKADNFWEHGSGPCGPCSEIYYDRGEKYGCGKPDCTVGCDCDRYMEVWNNVFSQFDNDGEGHYTELIQKNIDTGMGLERLAVVCQDVDSLFDVDTVMNITHKVSELTGAFYGQSVKNDVSLRVITDHIRSATFMICDGVLPSNEGRGYVLRRLLRRASRHGKLLGVNDPFLYQVIDTVVHENEGQYPEVREKQAYITRVVKTEEESFGKTIDAGMKIFNDLLEEHRNRGDNSFSGSDAFKLYDTYGFPLDLTIEMCEDAGMSVDEAEFRKLMEDQRVRARKAREALGDLGWSGIEFGKEIPATEFVGYEEKTADAKILAIVADDEFRDEIVAGAEALIVFDKTVLYAEMGGQLADYGTAVQADSLFEINNVQKNKGGKYMHYGVVKSGSFKVGDTVTLKYDENRRDGIRRAHTATHILQAALVQVLGDHVHQAGSLVEPDHLRFDFTHFSAVTEEELKKVSDIASGIVLSGFDVNTLVLPIAEAKQLGATALFGEKYGEVVRVVKIGDVSMEFCGGTHADNSAKVGMIYILSEGSVASGVRRIEAVTGAKVIDIIRDANLTIADVADKLKCSVKDVAVKAESATNEIRSLKQEIDRMKDRMFAAQVDGWYSAGKDINGIHYVQVVSDAIDSADIRKIGDIIKAKSEDVVAVIAVKAAEKCTMLAVCGKAAVAAGIKAGDVIKYLAANCGGSGGGKPDSAMGGCKDFDKLCEAVNMVEGFILEKRS